MHRFLLAALLLLFSSACNLPASQLRSTPTATRSLTPAETATALPTFTLIPSRTPTPTVTATLTPTPTPLIWVGPSTALPPALEPITTENAELVSCLAQWQAGSLSDLAWTPDGLLLAVANQSEISLYDPLTRQPVRTLYPQGVPLLDIEFSPLGTWLISGSRQGSEEQGFISRLELWQGPGWKPRGLLYDVPLALSGITFTPDGKAFAAAYSSPIEARNEMHFWDVTDWQITETLQTGAILNIGFSPDGKLLAATPDRYALRILDVGKKAWIYDLPTSFTGAVNVFAFSPDSQVLASGHYDGMIRLWDMRTGVIIREFQSNEVIQSLAFSPDGRLLASGGSFETHFINLWDVATGQKLRRLQGYSSGVTRLLFSPTNIFLVSGSYDGDLRIWGIRP